MRRDELSRALADLRVAIDDADAVTQDMLRPTRLRELGPVLHAENYRDARARVLTAHAHLVKLAGENSGEHDEPSGGGGPPAD